MAAMTLPAAAKRLGLDARFMRKSLDDLRRIGLQCHRERSPCRWRIDADSVDLVKARMESCAEAVRQRVLSEVLR